MSQSGLAARLGVSRPALNRALVGLIRRGWLASDNGSFLLTDAAALRHFADS
jgi:DNA-binding IclR family transcriptional regulator